jgi:diaminobutyrate-2-oxoglutarate transaminase
MMQGVDVGSASWPARSAPTAFRNGLIIETSGAHDEVVKVLAPLTTPGRSSCAKGLAILEQAAQDCTADETKIAAE